MRRDRQHRNHGFLRRIGEYVREQRVALMITQEELAERAQLHRTYVTDIENGFRNPAILTLARIALALELPMWKIVHFAENDDDPQVEVD